MITVQSMKELLSTYGINSDKDLDIAIRKQGGIRIDVFTSKPDSKNKSKAE